MKITQEHIQMIDDCIKRQDKLSEWEINFIVNIEDKESLSDKQIEKLELIWDKVTENR